MPLLIAVLLVLGLAYQLFFRYEHWPSTQQEGVYYEHDNLTGETYRFNPNAHVSVFARLLGRKTDAALSEALNHSGDEEDGFFEPFNPNDDSEKAELEPRPDSGNPQHTARPRDNGAPPVPGPVAVAAAHENPPVDAERAAPPLKGTPVPVPHEVIVASSQPPVPMAMLAADLDESSPGARPFAVRQVDLNKDGTPEEIIQNAAGSDGLLDISIVENGQEVFFGRGRQISLLSSNRVKGWPDIALRTGNAGNALFRYDPASHSYKPFKG